jgi:hypothetical protein
MIGHSQNGRQGFSLPAAITLFACAFVVLAWPWLSGRVTIPWDAKAQFHPQLQFLAASLANGESPFWTPNVFSGWPQIADPQSLIFSPLHFLLALATPNPNFWAADAVTFAMLFIGGVSVIAFFRDRGWHVAGALVAALVFCFGGSAASRLQHIGQVMSMAYVPLALWLLSRTLERRSWFYGLAAGIVIGLLAIGRDQVALLGLYLLAAFVITYWFATPDWAARIRRTRGPLSLCGAAAIACAAIPLLLTALLAADSNRPAIGIIEAERGSLYPGYFLTLAFADLYGANDPSVDFWGVPSIPWMMALGPTGLYHAQNVGQLYIGALPLIAILSFGLVRGQLWSREIRFFTIAAAVTLLYALGWYTPFFRAAYEIVPGVALFRRPADATFILGTLFAILSGYLVHRWVSGTMPTPRWWQRAFEAVLAFVVVAAAVALAIGVSRISVAIAPILIGMAFALAGIGVLVAIRRLALTRKWAAAALLVAFMASDLGWNNRPNESTGLPPEIYDALGPDTTDETVLLLKHKLAETAAPDRRDRVEMIGIGYHWPNLSLAHGFDHLFGHNPLRLREFSRATGVGDTVASPDQRGFTPLFPSYRSTFADLFGLRVIATSVPAGKIDTSLRPGDLNFLARTAEAYVYENPRALPRAMLVPEWRVADFEELLRAGWPDVDPTRTVLLDRPCNTVASDGGGGNASVRIERYANTEVMIDVDSRAGGMLVLNDVWQPWWQAEVDDTSTEIFRANVLFRAVAVGPGHHRVRFSFHPLAGAFTELRDKLAARFAKARP